MAKTANKMAKCTETGSFWAWIVLRVGVGLFFFFAGLPKLQALFGGTNPLAGFGIPVFLAWIVAIVETVGGIFLLIGLCSMSSGILISITMLVAIILTATKNFDARSLFQHVLYIGGALVLAFNDKKWMTIDSLWKKK